MNNLNLFKEEISQFFMNNNHIICEEIYAEWLDYPVLGAEEKELILKKFYGPFSGEIVNSKISALKKNREGLLSKLGVCNTIEELGKKVPMRKDDFAEEDNKPSYDKPTHLSFNYFSELLFSNF